MTKQTIIATLAFTLAGPNAFARQAVPPPLEQPRSVTLSLAEYNRLLDLERRAPAVPAAPPLAAVVSSADLKIIVERDVARGTFSLSGQVLRGGVNRVPLVSGATLADVTSGGRPVPLMTEGAALHALIDGPGPFAVNAEWGGQLSYRPGRASFVLPVPQAGAARATIEVPGEQADVRLSAGLITRRSVANGRTTIEATLDPGSATEVWWSMRDAAPVAAAKDLRALAEIMTLITLDDSDVRMVALIDINVTQGELRRMTVQYPAGYEFQSVSGSTLEEFSPLASELILTVGNPEARSHQFLITLERPHQGGSFNLDTGVISLKDIQRERGEIAIEGVGTMDLAAEETPGLHRIDVRELNPSLQSLARLPILSAFRYQRPSGTAAPRLALDVKRFADASVLAAAADRAIATTLVTGEGRALTEVRLDMRNRSQPFLKVELPPGATIISVDLAGRSAKPASGADGTRIPLMRAGLPADRPYSVSFVYVHSGTPFLKKGDIQMSLPKMDVPIGVVHWEVFVPEQYRARAIDGNMIDANKFPSVGFGLSSGNELVVNTSSVAMAETITVTGQVGGADQRQEQPMVAPSQNVVNLQQRAAGVLPIRVDVPRAGVSHQFVKPLVVGSEATVKLRYKRN
jgi:hypothetical protein